MHWLVMEKEPDGEVHGVETEIWESREMLKQREGPEVNCTKPLRGCRSSLWCAAGAGMGMGSWV